MAPRDIGEWLEGLGLERYEDAFSENEIDLDALRYISEEDLEKIGVALGARRKMLAAIASPINGKIDESVEEIAPTLSSERRQVTVLFADLAGFTQLSGELGAEATHGLLNRYFETVDRIIEGYGGSIDKHIGDNVMGVFGAPLAHSDDPERAARAALDVHRAMSQLSEECGRSLRAHIGLASGQVVASGTGSAMHREYTVTGESVNLASRLQDKAGPGETLISHNVYGSVSGLADCTPMAEIVVKGFDAPVQAWRLAGLRSDISAARDSPFVGRHSEKRQFTAMVEACLETGVGQALFIRGEAGIGKTRLVEEFAAIAEIKGLAIHKGLILDFGIGKGQDAIRSVVRSFLGLASSVGKTRRREATDQSIDSGWLAPDDRVFMNDLLDLPQPVGLRSLYDAMDNPTRNDGKQAVVTKLLRSLSKQRPLLITVEDIHWADPLTLVYLARTASVVADCAAILVMTSRLDGDPLDQAWRVSLQGSPLTTIDLQPLRETEAEEMAKGLSESAGTFLEECIARAEGNPLFLEQLLRNADKGALEEVPGSIQSLVLARMDRLDHIDKRALQAASIVGQRFSLDLLQHLTEDPNYVCDKLLEQHLVRPEGGGYLFAHALVQEGVYSSLLQARKCDLHRRAADWFAKGDFGLRAEHLDRAEDLEAPRAYLEAAKTEIPLYHYDRAFDLTERGLMVARAVPDKFALACLKGQVLRDLGSIPESIETYRAALDLAADAGERAEVLYGLAAGMRLIDELDQALEVLDQAEAGAVKYDLTLMLSKIHHLRGNLYFPMGNIEGCLEEHELALKYARQAQSPEHEARALGGLGDAAYSLGRMRTAYGYFEDCITLCREHGFGRIEVAYLSMVGFARQYVGELQEALEDGLETIKAAARIGQKRAELLGRLIANNILFDTAELVAAREHLEQAKILAKQLGARRFEAVYLKNSAKLLRVEGRRAEALKLCEQAAVICRETGVGFAGPQVLAELALNTDDPVVRRQALQEGESMLNEGVVSHNHFHFYRDAMEACLISQEWDEVSRYATALEIFTRSEPLTWCDFFVDRARALAAVGRGERDKATLDELRRLRDEGERMGLKAALPALEAALKANQSPRPTHKPSL